MNKVLMIGATSAIAQEVAKLYAGRGCSLFLLGRNEEKLAIIAQDLQVRGAPTVTTAAADLTDTARHQELLAQAQTAMNGLDIVVIAYGTLSDQTACERDFAEAERELHINFLSVTSWLTHVANDFAAKQSGQIAVIGSVAGDRGRQSNYVYGAAKGGLAIFLQGLRNRLYPLGVQVLTVKPGFTDTPMTAHLDKNFLFVGPGKVAADIVKGLDKGRHEIYTPWFWGWILRIIRTIPEFIFIRMKL